MRFAWRTGTDTKSVQNDKIKISSNVRFYTDISTINRINLHRSQECLNMVPAYVTRVDFKLNEMTFNQCMNEAEKELNVEQQMLSRSENVNSILRRNVVSRNANLSMIITFHTFFVLKPYLFVVIFRNISITA